MSIDVLYDLSLMGAIHANGWNCAGICRVTQRWAEHLDKVGGLRLGYHYGTHLNYAFGAAEAARAIGACSHSVGRDFLLRHTKEYVQRFSDVPVTGFRKPIRDRDSSGVAREAAVRGQRLLAAWMHRFLTRDHEMRVRQADIFHDTSFPGPTPVLTDPTVSVRSELRKLITIYDMIPMTHGQYFPPGVAQLFENRIRELDEHHWVVCSAEHVRSQLCDMTAVLPERVTVIPWAADRDVFHPVDEHELIERVRHTYGIAEQPYILSVCTLEPRKNLAALIRCFAELVASRDLKDVALVLVGGMGWIPSVMEEIDGLRTKLNRNGANVHTIGFVPDADLAALYSGALAFVYPSIVEGFGLPPLEAMQCGVPVITSNTSALPEVIGDAGIMVDPFDRDALKQAILDVCSRPTLREELARRSLDRAAVFSWERTARETVDLYRLALANEP